MGALSESMTSSHTSPLPAEPAPAAAPSRHWTEAELEALHPRAFAWALSCCEGRREDAEDALQTVYLKIFEGRARFGGRSRLETWLFAVIRRTAADLSRRRGLRNLLLGRWLDQERREPAHAPDPGGRLRAAERAGRVRRVLSALPARQRQVLELVFFHEHSLSEAAEVLGVGLGTARTHYHRAKKAALERLREEVGDARNP